MWRNWLGRFIEVRNRREDLVQIRTVAGISSHEAVANDPLGVDDECARHGDRLPGGVGTMEGSVGTQRIPFRVCQEGKWSLHVRFQGCATLPALVHDRQDFNVVLLELRVPLTQLCQLLLADRSPITAKEDHDNRLTAKSREVNVSAVRFGKHKIRCVIACRDLDSFDVLCKTGELKRGMIECHRAVLLLQRLSLPVGMRRI